jgi:hypothetical protein
MIRLNPVKVEVALSFVMLVTPSRNALQMEVTNGQLTLVMALNASGSNKTGMALRPKPWRALTNGFLFWRVAGSTCEKVEDVFHVLVLEGFEFGVKLGMEIVPSCERGRADEEGHGWVLGC